MAPISRASPRVIRGAVHSRAHRRRRRLHAHVPRRRRLPEHLSRSLRQRRRPRHARRSARARWARERLLWGCDLTMCTGLAKLRALDVIGLSADDIADIRWRNAARIFPAGSFPAAVAASRYPLPAPRNDRRQHARSVRIRSATSRIRIPDVLVRVLDREGIDGAWVGHLPSAFYRDPTPGNAELYSRAAPICGPAAARSRRFGPIGRAGSARCDAASDAGAPAVRAYPPQWGLGPARPADARARARGGRAGNGARCSRCASRICGNAIRWTRAGDLTRRGDPLAGARRRRGATRRHRRRPRDDRRSPLGSHAGGAAAGLLGHLVDLGPAGGSSGEAVSHHRRAALRVRDAVAAAADADAASESRSLARRRVGRVARGCGRDLRAVADRPATR